MGKLGEGGYGQVYKIQNKNDHKDYAIKKCHLRELTEKDTQNVLNETQIILKLRSEFVIQYYYQWIEQNCLYFQIELCIDNLNNVLKTKKSLFTELMTIYEFYISFHMFQRLTECVQYLHEFKPQIIHRDIKPDNVLISIDRRIKLCDFGISKEVYNLEPYVMSADIGDLSYQAPEAQTNDYNHKADIYSLALIGAQIFGFDRYDIMDG
ncbi:unnamed protein product, partial [Oppiella nova]